MSEITAQEIAKKHQKDVSYKKKLSLYDNVKKQENFYNGKQWEGVNAPDLPKPTLNFIKRVVNWLISVLIVDDVGIAISNYSSGDINNLTESEGYLKLKEILPTEIERINENIKLKSKLRNSLLNGAVDGDVGLYVRFDPDKTNIKSKNDNALSPVQGEITAEIVDNTNIHFGNHMISEVQEQPYIILSRAELTSELKNKYPEKAENIKPDSDESIEDTEEEITTELLYFYKENGTVHFISCTKDVILIEDTDTEQSLYPLSFFSWERKKKSCHGISVVEEIIPNQIAVNKLWAMAILFCQNNAFPKIFVDKTKVPEWNNNVGSVMGVIGNPNDAFASSFKGYDMSNQVIILVDKIIAYTKEFMGANDAVLGNVNPTNTSALIQMQKASAMPLELQRIAFYQFIEDYVRIAVDIIRTKYGIRIVENKDGKKLAVDFGELDYNADIRVDIGAASAWSEVSQIQTMNNLFQAGIITDAELYLDSIPDRILPNKNKILEHIREKKEELIEQQQMAVQGVQILTDGGVLNEMQMQ